MFSVETSTVRTHTCSLCLHIIIISSHALATPVLAYCLIINSIIGDHGFSRSGLSSL